jgi:flagellar L-ring protein precursor FlgH
LTGLFLCLKEIAYLLFFKWHKACINPNSTRYLENIMNQLIKLLTLFSVVFISACNTTAAKRDPAYAPVRPIAVPEAPKADGAIFNVSNHVSYFEDYRARRVGDILTVTLDELTQAEKGTATIINKASNSEIANPTILGSGLEFNAPGILPLASNKDNNGAFELSSSNTLNAIGDSDQNNLLRGDISVSVVEVLANGNMLIRGEKVVTINQGNEYLRIAGMISPRDIDANNSISSKRIADVQMAYVGDGPVNDANVLGWLSRFFISSLMPF